MTDGDLRQLIAAKAVAVEREDWYGLLDVEKSAKQSEIKRAYTLLVKLLHPDKLVRRDIGDMHEPAKKVFSALQTALETMTSDQARSKYNQKLAGEVPTNPATVEGHSGPQRRKPEPLKKRPTVRRPPPSQEPVLPKGVAQKDLMTLPIDTFKQHERIEIARFMHIEGAERLNKADFRGAEACFKRATDLDPEYALYSLNLGWALFRNPARSDDERRDSARKHLERAVAHDAYNPDARFCFAQYWRDFGTREQYRRELEACLRCKEDHAKAKAELQSLNEEDAAAGGGPRGTMGFQKREKKKESGLRRGLNKLLGRD